MNHYLRLRVTVLMFLVMMLVAIEDHWKKWILTKEYHQ